MKILHFTILTLILSITFAASQSLPGCPDKCGNITIPYPFGTKKDCYLSKSYLVKCNMLRVWNNTFKLLDISLDGQMRGILPMGYRCYNKNRGLISVSEPRIPFTRFPISSTKNLLTAVGCDTRANIKSFKGEDYITGCLSMTGCDRLINGSCLGMGCSQVPVPYDLTSFRIHAQSNTGKVGKWSYNNCTYAFLVEKDRYTFAETDLDNMHNRSFPVVFEWSVGSTSCKIAQMNKTSYLCKENSVCYDDPLTSFNRRFLWGYRCKCAQGYQGNPYLPNGCQDINECEGPKQDCVYACGNTNGSYDCSCPLGMGGDGRTNGSGCSYLEAAKSLKSSVYVGISMGTAGSAVLTLILYFGIKQRQIMKSREKFFKKNGGLVLQKLLFESKQSSHIEKIIFAARVLEKATTNFHKSNVIGQGGFGVVYKGVLADKTTVAIKKSKSIDENQIEQFINEVIILSEINHPNVVKLLGCCLETQTPLLVYEFVTNKTLFHHLHEKDISSMAFERRLNLAVQISEALAHIHSSTQIIHRDVKSSNILLTDDFTAKVSDFGISRFIPIDETHLQTLVHGTLGYIDPEYFRSGILTIKSDVYSFGMVLIELLTGRKVFSPDGTESELGLATFFVSSMERGRLIQVLDDRVRNNGVNEHIERLAKLAKHCVELEGKKRPTMGEVKEKLEELRQSYLKSCMVSTKIKFIDVDELILFD